MTFIEGITKRDYIRFTEGDCHVLAKRLHRVAGLPLHSFLNIDGEPCDHAFVMHKGKPLDVMGLHEVSAFIAEWSHQLNPLKISPPMQLKDFYEWQLETGPEYGHYSYAAARRVADILVEKFVR